MCAGVLTSIKAALALTLLVLIVISSPPDFAAFSCPPAVPHSRQKLAGKPIDGALSKSQASKAPCVLKLLNTLNAPGESFGQAFFPSFAQQIGFHNRADQKGVFGE